MNPEQHAPASAWAVTAPDDFYYATLYLPPTARDAARILEATRRAITDIPGSCVDRGVAHLKLAWWQTELLELAAGTPRHPLARALLPLVNRDPAVLTLFEQLVTATIAALHSSALGNRRAMLDYVHTQHGPLLDYYIGLGPAVSGAQRVALLAIGALLELAYALRGLRQQRRNGLLLLAEEELHAARLSVDAVRAAQVSDELRVVLAPYLDWLHDELMIRVAALPRSVRRQQRLFATLAVCGADALALTRADGCMVLERRVEILPLRKLWLAWRTACWG